MSSSKKVEDRKQDTARFITPLTYCIQKQYYQIIFFFLGLFSIFYSCLVLKNVQIYSVGQYAGFLVNFVLPDNSALSEFQFCTLTLLHKGCSIASFNMSVFADGPNLHSAGPVHPPQAVEMDGFEIELPSVSEPVTTASAGVLLLALSDDGNSWSVAGSSTLRYLALGARFLTPTPVPWQRTADVTFLRIDFRPPWPTVAEPAVSSALGGIGLLVMAALGVAGRPATGRRTCIWLCSLLAINSIAAAAALVIGGAGSRAAFRPVVEATLLAGISASLLVHGGERGFFERLLIAATAAVAGRVIDDCALYDDVGNLAASPPLASLCAAGWAATFLILNRTFLRRCLAAVAADCSRLESVWARLQSDPAERAALTRLDAACEMIAKMCPVGSARSRQFNRMRIRSALTSGTDVTAPSSQPAASGAGAARAKNWRSGRHSSTMEHLHALLRWDARDEDFESRNTVPGHPDVSSPVTSLDQLYGARARACTRSRTARQVEELVRSRVRSPSPAQRAESSLAILSLAMPCLDPFLFTVRRIAPPALQRSNACCCHE